MIAGRGTEDQGPGKAWAYRKPDRLDRVIERVVDASIIHLVSQLEAGADAVQIFDTWAGNLDAAGFVRYVVEPTARIVSGIRAQHPEAKVIGFPRGAGGRLPDYVRDTGVDAVGLDWGVDPHWAAKTLACPMQGNLDPLRLLGDLSGIDAALARLFKAMRGRPYVFNLGHGITPEAPIAAVEHLMARVRAGIV
jgi:uroporphyrinogen decarboxylase